MKRRVPTLWVGSLAIIVDQALTRWPVAEVSLWWLAPPRLASAMAHGVIRKRVSDLVDEVWDEDESLSVRNGDTEVSVVLRSIVNVHESILASPQRATGYLREVSALGWEFTFMPPMRWPPWRHHPRILDCSYPFLLG